MKSLIITIQFLTRIPINKNLDVNVNDFAKGIIYFPIIGLIIGGFNLIFYYGAYSIFHVNASILALLYVITNIIITGGLHIDGIADTCDAIFSGRSKDRMLEIMKDSYLGTFGALAIVIDCLAKFVLVSELKIDKGFVILLVIPVIAKTCIGLLMYISTYAREKGMGGFYLDKVKLKHVIICEVTGIAICYCIMGIQGLILLVVGILIMLMYRQYIYNKIQGMTGDTIGAANEIIEIALLFIFVVAFGSNWV